MIREDNADLRLTEIGHSLGLIDGDTVKDVKERQKQINDEINRVRKVVMKPVPLVNQYLADHQSMPIDNGIHLDQLLKRSELDYEMVSAFAPPETPLDNRVVQQVEIEVKYEGYIQKQLKEIEKFNDLEEKKIPENFDFAALHGLSNELKEKLSAIRPVSLGQASRIDGMTPVALSILMIGLKVRA
jgi:tRNA uridine 5-carboxymethylaminomethyl modification enzyme